MSLFKGSTTKSAISRKLDEAHYAYVASEMSDGVRNEALWIKALEEANGDPQKQIAEYIKLRVQSLKDDIHLSQKSESKSKQKIEPQLNIEKLVQLIDDGSTIDEIVTYLNYAKSKDDLALFLNTKDAADSYPLHIAAKRSRTDLITLFIKYGADPMTRNYWGKTPLDIAIDSNKKELIHAFDQ